MIAAAAWPRFVVGEFAESALTAEPGLALGVGGLSPAATIVLGRGPISQPRVEL